MLRKKIIYICSLALILVTPVIYSHIYFPGKSETLYDLYAQVQFTKEYSNVFVSDIMYRLNPVQFVGYERVKMLFFVGISMLIFFTIITSRSMYKKKNISSLLYIFLTAAFISVFAWFFLWWIPLESYLFGSLHKMHWVFLLIWVTVFYFALRTIKNKHIRYSLLIALSLVLLYWYCELAGIDPNEEDYITRLDRSRVFGTLGNPNYLAWFILIMLPLIMQIKARIGRYVFLWLALVILFHTGSLIGIVIALLFLVYSFSKKWQFALLTLWVIIAWSYMYCIIGLNLTISSLLNIHKELFIHFFVYPVGTSKEVYLDHLDLVTLPEKIRWFLARPYFWSSGMHMLISDVVHFFFWVGPDQLSTIYKDVRHPFLTHDIFEHTDYTAGRVHNFFLDNWINWWLLPFLYIVYMFGYVIKKGNKLSKEVFILFLAFFFFNIPVISHYIVLLAFASTDRKLHPWKSQN